MATAAAGEPLRGRHAVLLYSAQSVKGTPVTPATAIGIAPLRENSQSGARPIFGLGNPQYLLAKPGVAQVDTGLSGITLQSSAFILACCVRGADGTLPYFTLGIGYKDDAAVPVMWSHQIQDCKVHSWNVSLDAPTDSTDANLMQFGFTAVGGLITDLSNLSPANLTSTPFASYDAVVTKNGSAHACRSFSVDMNHNVRVYSVLAGSAPATFKRGWTHQTEGDITVTGSVSRYVKSGQNMQADTMSASETNLVIALTDVGGSGNTMTLTATSALYTSEEQSCDVSGDYVFTTPFIAKNLTAA